MAAVPKCQVLAAADVRRSNTSDRSKLGPGRQTVEPETLLVSDVTLHPVPLYKVAFVAFSKRRCNQASRLSRRAKLREAPVA